MMTQPIQMFENLTSETAPAGGNDCQAGFTFADRRLSNCAAVMPALPRWRTS